MIDESESSVVEELDSVADEYVSELQVTMEDGEVVRNKKYSGTKKRYLILGLFIALSASNSFQWIEYAIVAHAIVKFYNVSYALVDWTSVIYMLTYIAFVIPARYVAALILRTESNFRSTKLLTSKVHSQLSMKFS